MKKALFISRYFNPGFGGTPVVGFDMASELFKKDVQVDVLCGEGFVGNVINFKSLENLKHNAFISTASINIQDYSYVVILGAWSPCRYFKILVKAKLLGIKIIYQPKGMLSKYEFTRDKLLKLGYFYLVEFWLIFLADEVIYSSTIEMANIFRYLLIPSRNIFIFPEFFLKLKLFDYISSKNGHVKNNEEFIIGIIAQFSERKSLIQTIDAFIHFKNSNPSLSAKLLIAGTPVSSYFKTFEQIQRKVNSSLYKDSIVFLGQLNGKQKKNFFLHVDLIANVSLFESFGLVPLEAIQYGCMILTTINVGSLSEIESDYIYKISLVSTESIFDGITEMFLRRNKLSPLSSTISLINKKLLKNPTFIDHLTYE